MSCPGRRPSLDRVVRYASRATRACSRSIDRPWAIDITSFIEIGALANGRVGSAECDSRGRDPLNFGSGRNMDAREFQEIGHQVVDLLADYLDHIEEKPVFPRIDPQALRNLFDEPLPE